MIPWKFDDFGSAMDPKLVRKALSITESSALLHLAWASTSNLNYDQSQDHHDWGISTIQVVRECLEIGVKPFILGSAIDGDSVGPNSNPYQIAKINLRSSLEGNFDPDTFCLIRPYYIVSPVEKRPRILAEAMYALNNDQEFLVKNPENLVDYIHVDDVATAIDIILNNSLSGLQGIKSGFDRNPASIVRAAACYLKTNQEKLEYFNQEAIILESSGNENLRSLGWEPTSTNSFFNFEQNGEV
jgi:nucleoside-diphosphate-sugar epimerase